ncbi:MAG TPA: D-alanyl-D-alanine carboxypeptidase family protein [Caulobacteraceae bacterium]|nr:D-alanyl-D-alanine carboxypeptidase family protein [Caulobacteraceae bacterium]
MSKRARSARRLALAILAAVAAPALGHAQTPYFSYLRVDEGGPKYAAIVMDANTGEVLFDKRADEVRYPASLTKIMTLYLTFQALASGRLHTYDRIVVSPLAAAQSPTKLGLRAGETISVENAMHGMAVHSANDMAVAMAERIGGTESRFAEMMTAEAQRLGMTHTRYVNANGLPDSRQVTSARDIAILVRAVLRDYPQYYHYFSDEEFTYAGRTYYNTNHLLGRMPGVDGLKTGFTNAAGFNLAASAVRNGHRLIAVELGGPSGGWRNENVEELLLAGFDAEDRRDRGQGVMLAQNAFTVAPYRTAARAQPAAAQPNDPIDVILTGATARPASMALLPSVVQAVRPGMLMAQLPGRPGSMRPAAPTEGRAARTSSPNADHRFFVQVGEYSLRSQARAQVERVARRFTQQFDSAEGRAEPDGRHWRAWFSGFTRGGADAACQSMRRAGLGCEVGEEG